MSHTSQYWQKWSPVEEGTLLSNGLPPHLVGSKLIWKFYKKIFFFLAAGGFSNMLSWLLLFHQQISGVGAEIEAAWLCCASDRLHLHHSNKTLPWYNSKQKYKNTNTWRCCWCSLTSRSLTRAFQKPARTPDAPIFWPFTALPTFFRPPSASQRNGRAQIIDPA